MLGLRYTLALGVTVACMAAPSLTLNTTTLTHLAPVRLTFSGLPTNDTGIFFAVFFPANASVDAIAPLPYPATPPWTKNAPAKWITCAEMPGCLSAGAGTHDFILPNPFTDVRIVAFTGGIEKPTFLASSPAISFTDSMQPFRVHVSRTRSVMEMRVTWNTRDVDGAQGVQWGTASGTYTNAALSQPRTYAASDMCGEPASTHGWFNPFIWNTALMTGLEPGTIYYYRVGVPGSWSAEESFRTAPAPGPHAPVSMLFFADMNTDEYDGTTIHWQVPDAGLTMQRMADRARSTGDGYQYTLAVHAGDISYATGYQAKWVNYDSRLEHSGLVNRVPYLIGQGNHERDVPGQGFFTTSADSGGECGVSTEVRYPGPEPTVEMQSDGWWALAHGSVFIVMLNSELEIGAGSDQFDFLVATLAAVNRSVTPWCVVFLHRPIYAVGPSATGGSRDTHFGDALEPTLLKYHVDLFLVGHVHNAFASAGGIYQSKTIVPPAPDAYAAPIHACIGNAGMGLSGINATHPPAWTEWQMNAYGYSDMTAYNETHAEMRFFDDATDTLQHTISMVRAWPRVY